MSKLNGKQALVLGAAVAATGAAIVVSRRRSHHEESFMMEDKPPIPDQVEHTISEIERELPGEPEPSPMDRLPQT
jgi:hypothetical protein